MSNPIQAHMQSLRRRMTRLIAVRGIAWLALVAAGGLVFFAAIDYVWRWQSPAARGLVSSFYWGAVLATFVSTLLRPLRWQPSDEELAKRVEERYPALDDRLRTAVDFLKQSEASPLTGSVALREAAVLTTAAEIERYSFREVLDARPAARVGITAAVSVAAMIAMAVAWPGGARVAAARVVNPLSRAAWPQAARLALIGLPAVVSRGTAFEVRIAAAPGTRLPPEVRALYRWRATGPADEADTLPVQGAEVVARHDHVESTFWFRAVGGDDDSMPWQRVAVADRPRVQSLVIEATPPPYTRLAARAIDPAANVLSESVVRWQARADIPLAAAGIHFADGQRVPLTVAADEKHFAGEAIVTASEARDCPAPRPSSTVAPVSSSQADGALAARTIHSAPNGALAYWFELTARNGTTSGDDRRYALHVVTDAPPELLVDEPAAGAFATTVATLPLRGSAHDDVALRSIDLTYEIPGGSVAAGSISLAELARNATTAAAHPTHDAAPLPAQNALELRFARDWSLETLPLSEGQTLALTFAATDEAGKTTRIRRSVAILPPREVESRILAGLEAIRAAFERLLSVAHSGRDHSSKALAELRSSVQPSEIVLTQLALGDSSMRAVGAALRPLATTPRGRLDALRDALARNQIANSPLRERLDAAAAILAEFHDAQHLRIAASLNEALQALEVLSRSGAAASETELRALDARLSSALAGQSDEIRALERVIDALAHGDAATRFSQQLAQRLAVQNSLTQRIAAATSATLGRSASDLQPAESRDLADLARAERALAGEVAATIGAMAEAVTRTPAAGPSAATNAQDRIARALRIAAARGLSDAFTASAAQCESSQLGQALSGAREIEATLLAMLDALAGRGAPASPNSSSTQQAAAAVNALVERQAALASELEGRSVRAANDTAAHDDAARLAEEQRRVEADARAAAEGLDPDAPQNAAATIRRAMEQMQQSSYHAQRANLRAAAEPARRAVDELASAARILEQRRRADANSSDAERWAAVAARVRGLREEQLHVIAGTDPLPTSPPLTREQAAAAMNLAADEESLSGKVAELAASSAAMPALHWALDGAAREWRFASERLAASDASYATREAQRRGLAQLDLILEAAKSAPQATDRQANRPTSASQKEQDNHRSARSMAELRLMLLAQQSLSRRTAEWHERRTERAATPSADTPPAEAAARAALQELAAEQAALSQTLKEMLALPEPSDSAEEDH